MQSLIILGRQPALGLAELESLYGAQAITHLANGAALLDIPASQVDFKRHGGSIKLCTVLTELITTKWSEIEEYLLRTVPEHLQYVPEGKFRFGLSAYGFNLKPRQLSASGLKIKKVIKAAGRSVRIIPNQAAALSSAQVIHNKLTNATGWELVLWRNGPKTILALTKAEQDIEAYSSRDQNRPARDAKVGMLPPKLAQIIINLASDRLNSKPLHEQTLLDPFCGTGVLLQEALLMGYSVVGTDIEPRMIDYSKQNTDWLHTKTSYNGALVALQVGDATKYRWAKPGSFSQIAAETFLGKALSCEPSPDFLKPIIAECDRIHRGFLSNISDQIKPGTRLCLAVPAWRQKSSFLHLKTLDYLRELGYTRIDFVHATREDLIYFRPDQFVARELIVLTKN